MMQAQTQEQSQEQFADQINLLIPTLNTHAKQTAEQTIAEQTIAEQPQAELIAIQSASLGTQKKLADQYLKQQNLLSNKMQKKVKESSMLKPLTGKAKLNIKRLQQLDGQIQQHVDAIISDYLPKIEAELRKTLTEEARSFVCSQST